MQPPVPREGPSPRGEESLNSASGPAGGAEICRYVSRHSYTNPDGERERKKGCQRRVRGPGARAAPRHPADPRTRGERRWLNRAPTYPGGGEATCTSSAAHLNARPPPPPQPRATRGGRTGGAQASRAQRSERREGLAVGDSDGAGRRRNSRRRDSGVSSSAQLRHSNARLAGTLSHSLAPDVLQGGTAEASGRS